MVILASEDIGNADPAALSVATARRGWATAADVMNTRPLGEILDRPAARQPRN